MHPDRIFVGKVQDLQRRSAVEDLGAPDPQYEVLMAAPLLRELLLGEPPLMDLVNQTRRLKVRFAVARKPAYEAVIQADKPIFSMRGDGLHAPSALPGSTVMRLSRDQYLAEPVMTVQSVPITVHNIIDYAANAAGGVHFGDFGPHKRAVLAGVDSLMQIGGLEPALRALKAIGRVTVDALMPLVAQIEAGS